jgi:hypothetical protein
MKKTGNRIPRTIKKTPMTAHMYALSFIKAANRFKNGSFVSLPPKLAFGGRRVLIEKFAVTRQTRLKKPMIRQDHPKPIDLLASI